MSECSGCKFCCKSIDSMKIDGLQVMSISRYAKENKIKTDFRPYLVIRHRLLEYNICFAYNFKTNPCIFLRKYGCKIYENRPLQCRLLPFLIVEGDLYRNKNCKSSIIKIDKKRKELLKLIGRIGNSVSILLEIALRNGFEIVDQKSICSIDKVYNYFEIIEEYKIEDKDPNVVILSILNNPIIGE